MIGGTQWIGEIRWRFELRLEWKAGLEIGRIIDLRIGRKMRRGIDLRIGRKMRRGIDLRIGRKAKLNPRDEDLDAQE